jgi:caa(3)-type oxidase subunit IV
MAHDHTAAIYAEEHHEVHPDSYYIKIWGVLLVLLVISVLGPMLENKVITLITAFGIALVKAAIVCAYFMHLNIEKRYITYMLLASIFFMTVMFSGISPDVLKSQGDNWRNVSVVKLPPLPHHAGSHEGTAHENAANPHAGNTHTTNMEATTDIAHKSIPVEHTEAAPAHPATPTQQ